MKKPLDKREKKEVEWVSTLERQFFPAQKDLSVRLSLILPVYNCAEKLPTLLDSIRRQEYKNLELIVLDAHSIDRTLEILHHYKDIVTRIHTVTKPHTFEMFNRGISLATGDYITFVFPDTVYLSPLFFSKTAQAIHDQSKPDVLTCGGLQIESQKMKRIDRSFDQDVLKRGKDVALLSGCWFRASLFEKTGKFLAQYPTRASFELFCRLLSFPGIKVAKMGGIYVERHVGSFSYSQLFAFASETFRILDRHFSLWIALRWFFGLNHLEYFKSWWHERTKKLRKI